MIDINKRSCAHFNTIGNMGEGGGIKYVGRCLRGFLDHFNFISEMDKQTKNTVVEVELCGMRVCITCVCPLGMCVFRVGVQGVHSKPRG